MQTYKYVLAIDDNVVFVVEKIKYFIDYGQCERLNWLMMEKKLFFFHQNKSSLIIQSSLVYCHSEEIKVHGDIFDID
jgi:hypothetical protein